ncbi:hypothetical protein [Thioalkalivibrio sp. ARh3]|uniref:hypothetical protein n=1 Tax=Thioalkalivibrio sp. ARh3 TaxID=1158148 RepID=UPI00350FB4D5
MEACAEGGAMTVRSRSGKGGSAGAGSPAPVGGEYSGGRRSQWGVRLVASAIVITTAAAAGCAPWEEGEPSQASKRGNIATVASLETGDEHIRKADGTSLLRIDDLPRDIQVDEQNAFGATARFREAKVSPDDAWVAVVTTGAAHSAGWLVRADGSKASPAAFQYGGSVTIGPWSADGRYVVFAQEGPAGNRTLTVVDRDALGASVEASAIPVRGDSHGDLDPQAQRYEALGWANGRLLFRVGGEQGVFDPASREVKSE